MTILGRTKTRPILVVKGLSTTEAILGYDFIKQESLVVERARNEVYFSKEVPHAAAWSIATLRASKKMTLEPRSVQKVQANPFVGRQMLKPNLEGICASLDTDVGIWDAVARSDKEGQVTVAVVNITDKTYQVHKGDVTGSFRNLEQSGEELVPLDDEVVASIFGEIGKDPKEPEREQTESIDPKQAKELEAQLQIHATGSIRTRYKELIMQYHDVISKDKYDQGRASVIKHKIKMREGQPLHARQFRISFANEETIFDYVEELLRRVAIEVSRSPYNSPIFCVAKKKLPNAEEGDPVPLRVVLDYRGVNARSMPDRYSIKEVRECIDEIGRSDSDRYSCIDLTSGFWQMELEEEYRRYTAFSVPGKEARFHWCVAPMGLQGLPASFARLMDYVMRGILGVLTYIDDVLVHNKGHEDHLRTVEEVLLRLRK
jgi:hypothetical protein